MENNDGSLLRGIGWGLLIEAVFVGGVVGLYYLTAFLCGKGYV